MNDAMLMRFPSIRYYPELRFQTRHPQGVLDETLANRIVEFTELEEQICADAPFNRFTDFDGLTHIHLKISHAFQISERRRAAY